MEHLSAGTAKVIFSLLTEMNFPNFTPFSNFVHFSCFKSTIENHYFIVQVNLTNKI